MVALRCRQLDLVLERAILFEQASPLGCLSHALHDRHSLERLLDEIVGPLAHGADGDLDRAVRGHEHDLDFRLHLLNGSQKLQARRARHHQVRQDDVHPVAANLLERMLRVVGNEHAHAFALEDFLERLNVRALVVYDEHGRAFVRAWGSPCRSVTLQRRFVSHDRNLSHYDNPSRIGVDERSWIVRPVSGSMRIPPHRAPLGTTTDN